MGFCPLRSGSRPSRTTTLLSWATCVLAALGSGWDLGRLSSFDRRTRVSLHGQRGSGFPSPLAPSWVSCVLAAPGSGSHFGRLGEGDPTTRLSGHKRCGCQPCREVEAVVQRLGVTQCRGPGIQTVQSGRRPDVDPGLRSWATCVLAAPGSGSRLGWLDESDRKTRVTGHKRCGCQPCREAGGSPPPARGMAVAGTWGSVLPGAAAVRPEHPRSYPGRCVC